MQNGTVRVLNQGRIGTIDGPPTSIEGVARSADPSNAKLKVEFNRPDLVGIEFDYWIIDLGIDYEYAVVSSPSRGVLYILAGRQQWINNSMKTWLQNYHNMDSMQT